jgi:hypothetical protein
MPATTTPVWSGTGVALAVEQRRVRERRELAGMVAVKMADADVLDLLGRNLKLLQAIGDWRRRGAAWGNLFLVALVVDASGYRAAAVGAGHDGLLQAERRLVVW